MNQDHSSENACSHDYWEKNNKMKTFKIHLYWGVHVLNDSMFNYIFFFHWKVEFSEVSSEVLSTSKLVHADLKIVIISYFPWNQFILEILSTKSLYFKCYET